MQCVQQKPQQQSSTGGHAAKRPRVRIVLTSRTSFRTTAVMAQMAIMAPSHSSASASASTRSTVRTGAAWVSTRQGRREGGVVVSIGTTRHGVKRCAGALCGRAGGRRRATPHMLSPDAMMNRTHCCSRGDDFLFKTRNWAAKRADDCTADCAATPGCAYISWSKNFQVCAYCRSCEARTREASYASWRLVADTRVPALSPPDLSASSPPLLLVVQSPGKPAVLRPVPSLRSAPPPKWVQAPLNLAPARSHSVSFMQKVRICAQQHHPAASAFTAVSAFTPQVYVLGAWLRTHREVPDARLLVFIDGDVAWGGMPQSPRPSASPPR